MRITGNINGIFYGMSAVTSMAASNSIACSVRITACRKDWPVRSHRWRTWMLSDDDAEGMMRSVLRAFSVGVTLLCIGAAGQASAASLSGVQGEVLINAGQGLKPATGAANLKGGDIIIAQKGSAKLTYSDGCTIHIAPGSSATVGEKSPCAAQANVQTGQVAAAAPAAAGLPTAALAAGGLAIAGGVAIVAGQKDGKKKSASP
jgi:hypothetical protein